MRTILIAVALIAGASAAQAQNSPSNKTGSDEANKPFLWDGLDRNLGPGITRLIIGQPTTVVIVTPHAQASEGSAASVGTDHEALPSACVDPGACEEPAAAD